VRYSIDLTSPQGESAYFALFEGEWDDAEVMAASVSSPQGHAVTTDMAPYVTEGTVILNGDGRWASCGSATCDRSQLWSEDCG
jgi:hypothetical protein